MQNRPAGLTPSNFSKIMTGTLGLTDKQSEKLQGYYEREKALTDKMKEEVAKLEDKRDNPQWPQTCVSYAEEVALHLIGIEPDEIDTFWLRRGKELEPEAIDLYETIHFVEIEEKNRIIHPEYEYIHGEPDGLISDDTIIEIKCPNKANHLGNILNAKQLPDYEWQIQGYLGITGRQRCTFVSYHPEFPAPLNLHTIEVKRDEEMIKQLEYRCVKLWDEVVMPIYETLTKKIGQ